jgi:hypothetical protein
VNGALHAQRGDYRPALLALRRASLLAEISGLPKIGLAAVENRWRALAYSGELDLANHFITEAGRLARLVPGAEPPLPLPYEFSTSETEQLLESLLCRLSREVYLDGARIDEVLFSIWAIGTRDGSLSRWCGKGCHSSTKTSLPWSHVNVPSC